MRVDRLELDVGQHDVLRLRATHVGMLESKRATPTTGSKADRDSYRNGKTRPSTSVATDERQSVGSDR